MLPYLGIAAISLFLLWKPACRRIGSKCFQQEATMNLGSSRAAVLSAATCGHGRATSIRGAWTPIVTASSTATLNLTRRRRRRARSPRSNQRLHDAQHERARGRHAPARDDRDGRLHIESLRDIYAAIGESQRAAKEPPAPSASSSSVTTCRDSRQSGVPVRGPLAEHRPRLR